MNMDELLHALACDTIDDTKARFLNDRHFYLEMATEAVDDPGFSRLGIQLENKETSAAFETAHMLKGMIGNFGIAPMYSLISQIVEPLRTGKPDYEQLHGLFTRLLEQREQVRKNLALWS